MLEIEKYPIFLNNLSTLKETSKDISSGKDKYQFMTESKMEAVNFDNLKEQYCQEHNLRKRLHSVDSLIQTEEESILIEFKNGKVGEKELGEKIRDSLLLIADITGKCLSFSREHLIFILVYNEDIMKKKLQTSESREEIVNTISRRSPQKRVVKFKLGNYKELFFKDVYTYNQKEFECFLASIQMK